MLPPMPRNKDSRKSSSISAIATSIPDSPPPLPERNVIKENRIADSILIKGGGGNVTNVPSKSDSRRPSSLQQLQALDLFKYYSDDGDSFLLETEQYVKNMEKRRDRLLAQIDQQQQNMPHVHLKKVGYEIERRVVRALQHRSMKKKGGKIKKLRPFTTISSDRHRRRKRRRRARHRLCWKCITSSFKSLFNSVFVSCYYCTDSMTIKRDLDPSLYHNHIDKGSGQRLDETRTPTPKMLLMADGRIRWPVYQYGGTAESGMLISTNKLLVPPPSSIDEEEEDLDKFDPDSPTRSAYKSRKKVMNPGRENFSLSTTSKPNGSGNDQNVESLEERRGNKLLGWLQVRNSKGGKSSVFSQIVTPAAKGPFRKVPWQHGNGNLHVFKF